MFESNITLYPYVFAVHSKIQCGVLFAVHSKLRCGVLLQFTLNYGVEFLPMRCWIGLFVAIISIITVALEGSFLVRFVTRFAEEIFAILISIIFIYEVVLKLVHVSCTVTVISWPLKNDYWWMDKSISFSSVSLFRQGLCLGVTFGECAQTWQRGCYFWRMCTERATKFLKLKLEYAWSSVYIGLSLSTVCFAVVQTSISYAVHWEEAEVLTESFTS